MRMLNLSLWNLRCGTEGRGQRACWDGLGLDLGV